MGKLRATIAALIISATASAQSPIGLSGEWHRDPLACTPGPRTMIVLRPVRAGHPAEMQKFPPKNLPRNFSTSDSSRKRKKLRQRKP